MKLSELLKAENRTVVMDFRGEKVTITYRTGVFTAALERSLAEDLNTPGKQVQSLAALVCKVVESWDILDDAGNQLSPPEVADQLPIEFLAEVMRAIAEDMRSGGNPTSAGTFAAT